MHTHAHIQTLGFINVGHPSPKIKSERLYKNIYM